MSRLPSITTDKTGRSIAPVEVTIQIPYKRPGNVVSHVEVSFRISHKDGKLSAFPMYTADIKRLVNIPERIDFSIENGRVQTERTELNDLCKDIYQVMTDRQLFAH